MAFSERELADHLEMLEVCFWAQRRPPHHLREKIQEGQRVKGHSIELFFIRPAFRRPGETIEEPIAKIRYVRTKNLWHLFWQRADCKWHRYPPNPETCSLAEALTIIDQDEHCCFFG